MAVLSITQNRRPTDRQLDAALGLVRKDAPIVIMLHGFKYDPEVAARDPQHHIFALNPRLGVKRAVSWPRRFGLLGDQGLAIGFGWHARGTIWQAHQQASQAGQDLAQLIARLHAKGAARKINIVAHSLGARVALQAVQQAQRNSIGRVIMIAAALFEHELQSGLRSAAGQTAEFFNVRSQANTAFDLMLRLALPHWGRTVGSGRVQSDQLLDVAIDDRYTQEALQALGFGAGKTRSRICHWSGYLRDDTCKLFSALLHRPKETPLRYLQARLRQPDRKRRTPMRDTLSFLPRMPF